MTCFQPLQQWQRYQINYLTSSENEKKDEIKNIFLTKQIQEYVLSNGTSWLTRTVRINKRRKSDREHKHLSVQSKKLFKYDKGEISLTARGQEWFDTTTQKPVGYFPCRQCEACKKRNIMDKINRLTKEGQYHKEKCVITLTYKNDEKGKCLAGEIARININGEMKSIASLNKKHYQNFFKRLRRKLDRQYGKNNKPIKYFLVGEYGDKFERPHYHAIIYGWLPKDLEEKQRTKYYTSKMLTETWQMGEVLIDKTVTTESIAYIAQYVNKKFTKAEDMLTNEYGRTPEFCVGSQGYGKTWAIDHMEELFANDSIERDGKLYVIPEYYNKLMKRHDEERYEKLVEKRKEKYKDQIPDFKRLATQREMFYRKKRTVPLKHRTLDGASNWITSKFRNRTEINKRIEESRNQIEIKMKTETNQETIITCQNKIYHANRIIRKQEYIEKIHDLWLNQREFIIKNGI